MKVRPTSSKQKGCLNFTYVVFQVFRFIPFVSPPTYVACSRLSVGGGDRREAEAGEGRPDSGGEKERPAFVARPLFRWLTLTGSLEQPGYATYSVFLGRLNSYFEVLIP